MRRSFIRSALITVALSISVGLCFAVEDKPKAPAQAKAVSGDKATKTSTKAKSAAAPQPKLVDINSAGKAELKTLPGIGDAEADKIIAGRPYLTKAHLTTRDILSRAAYEALKQRVVAKQNKETAALLKDKQKSR